MAAEPSALNPLHFNGYQANTINPYASVTNVRENPFVNACAYECLMNLDAAIRQTWDLNENLRLIQQNDEPFVGRENDVAVFGLPAGSLRIKEIGSNFVDIHLEYTQPEKPVCRPTLSYS